jgi:REP element-mobilizing transposase RayT
MKLSQRGLIVQRCWDDIVNHRDNVELDAFQIMPNHIHGVMWLVGATLASPSVDQPHGLQSGSLGAIIGGFKSAVTREINRIRPGVAAHLWQPSFYEHVIRHERALDTIRDYIITNPERWELDAENPVGNGRDDFRLFLRENDVTLISKQGDASVAPTRERDV